MTADHYAAAGRGWATGAELVYRPWPPARPIAMDLSFGMLAWDAAARPLGAVADIRALPLAAQSADDAVAAFVLNHVTDPSGGLGELARVTRRRHRAGRRFQHH
jgi:ubiquinone/menaquinone biosynthesis C-methylase UbiE